VTTAVDK